MAAARTFHIRPVLNGQPLASAMRRLLPRESPAGVARLISGRRVQLNGNVSVDGGKRLKTGDVVKVLEHPGAAPATEDDVRVRYIDEHLVVVEKPAGVTTLRQADEGGRPGRRHDRMATLEEMLQRVVAKRFRHPPAPAARGPAPRPSAHPLAMRRGPAKPAHSRGARPPPPGRAPAVRPPRVIPVHRLDRDTSGLMLFALSPAAEHALTQAFKTHAIDRTYLAVVHGHPVEQTIESYFVRDRGDGLRGSSPAGKDDPAAQRAVTHVRPLERIGGFSLVECRLETGRTHQIRIHLAEIGHVLCGEKIYTHSASVPHPEPDRSAAPRQALHAHDLHFTHPLTHQTLHFRSPLPPDLAAWLDRLRRNPSR